MAAKVDIPMPQDLDLTSGWAIRCTAVDASGAAVSAVKVSNMAIVADSPTPDTSGLEAAGFVVGPYMLVLGPGG